ncbi:MAG: aspartate-semialdehyde dehydrogenase [Holosporaceae bacterium]|jgi:aspartate-semialdehyde dehydrogenase|nr:aspartate-semialdehyde dehydrogenase [Holosporaceae bacterium]
MERNSYNIAVVGATGNTGMETLQIIAERNFPINSIFAVASEKSSGKGISFRDKTLKTQKLSDVDFSKVDIAFFCAGSGVSRKNANAVVDAGCVIIDKTSCFRLESKVPLIIPEVNIDALKNGAPLGIISTPNCIAVPLAMTLKVLNKLAPLKRIVVSTYQSVSGAGRKAIAELYNQSKSIVSTGAIQSEVFARQIAFNVIPAIGNLYESGVSEEEDKISCEICKILKTDVKVALTCVRVPVFISHAMAVACEFTKPFQEEGVCAALENCKGIVVVNRKDGSNVFTTPLDAQGEDAVYVSRIRRDTTVENGLLYWVVTDNLRKGAALNSVQIAEAMISIDPQLKKFKKYEKAKAPTS